MLNIKTKQHIRCARVETPTSWLIVAVLLETRGTETIAVSEPRVIKVIPKTQLALVGSTSSKISLLPPAPEKLLNFSYSKILSPYVPTFGFAQCGIISWLAARPPTV